ncbi:hypothetical protein OK016_00775 [Vibrio chagasii]|nr:hypothetical protein [Vibrio chagasii]
MFIQSKQGFEPTTFVEDIGNFEQILGSIESTQNTRVSPESYQGDIKIYANTLFWGRFGSKLPLAEVNKRRTQTYSFVR